MSIEDYAKNLEQELRIANETIKFYANKYFEMDKAYGRYSNVQFHTTQVINGIISMEHRFSKEDIIQELKSIISYSDTVLDRG